MIGWADLPEWVSFLIRGVSICLLMCFCAVILARMGRHPYWALLAPLPFVLPVAVWILAYIAWPAPKRPKVI